MDGLLDYKMIHKMQVIKAHGIEINKEILINKLNIYILVVIGR